MKSLPDRGLDPRSLILVFNDVTKQQPADISMGLPRTPDIFIPYTANFDDLADPSPFAHLWAIVAAEDRAIV